MCNCSSVQTLMELQERHWQLCAAAYPHQDGHAVVYELVHGLPHLQRCAVELLATLTSWEAQVQAVRESSPCAYFLSTHQLVAAATLMYAIQRKGMR